MSGIQDPEYLFQTQNCEIHSTTRVLVKTSKITALRNFIEGIHRIYKRCHWKQKHKFSV